VKQNRWSAEKRIGAYLAFLIVLLIVASCARIGSVEIVKSASIKDISELTQRAVDKVVASVKPAVVRIRVVNVGYYQGRESKHEVAGSGVIISKEGHVVTNHHVAGKAKRIFCTLSNKEEIEADLVGTDPLADISVLKLQSNGKGKFPFAQFGDSSRLKVGDRVLAIGCPYAISQSVTMGIVSNTEMIMPELFWPFRFTLEGEDVGSIVRWIGHDAPIYGGNSGGPLVNLNGEIVGINEIGIGIGGAIPANLAKEIAEKLIANGKVVRSWLGFELQPLLKYSENERGVLISGTIEDSPAEKAGFHAGDILIRIAGKDVTVRFPEELPILNQELMDLPINEEVEAVVVRDKKELVLRVTTQEREYVQPKTREIERWGITARNLSIWTAKEMKRKNKDGVLVTTIRPGGPCGAARPMIVPDDVIVQVNATPVKSVEELVELTDKITEGKSEPVPVVVAFERKKEQHLTVVEVGIKELEDPGLEAKKAWLPVATQVLTRDIVKELGISGRKGVRVTQVYPNTSAEKAGIKVGDLIIALDGEPIPASEPEDYEVFPYMIRQYSIGSEAELTILRGKEELKLTVELVKSPKLAREMKKYRDENFELEVRDVAFLDRVREGWKEDQPGVLVESVEEGGWAALANLGVGDLILAVGEKPVPDVVGFEEMMKNIAQERPKSVVFQVLRGIHEMYIQLEPSWEKIE
jgi:serine protease Do